eukprot:836313-Prymnesium_polylepis.1
MFRRASSLALGMCFAAPLPPLVNTWERGGSLISLEWVRCASRSGGVVLPPTRPHVPRRHQRGRVCRRPGLEELRLRRHHPRGRRAHRQGRRPASARSHARRPPATFTGAMQCAQSGTSCVRRSRRHGAVADGLRSPRARAH